MARTYLIIVGVWMKSLTHTCTTHSHNTPRPRIKPLQVSSSSSTISLPTTLVMVSKYISSVISLYLCFPNEWNEKDWLWTISVHCLNFREYSMCVLLCIAVLLNGTSKLHLFMQLASVLSQSTFIVSLYQQVVLTPFSSASNRKCTRGAQGPPDPLPPRSPRCPQRAVLHHGVDHHPCPPPGIHMGGVCW